MTDFRWKQEITCAWCGKRFYGHGNSRYCCASHKRYANNRQERDKKRRRLNDTMAEVTAHDDAARAVAALSEHDRTLLACLLADGHRQTKQIYEGAIE